MSTSARESRGQTAAMRESIRNQLMTWANQARWVDDDRADRVFEKMNEAPERFISPDPGSCGSYREEASRVWQELKDEYGLRTEREAREEARRYESQGQQSAARALREDFGAIEAGDRAELVQDIRDEYGEAFVADVLADERKARENPGAGDLSVREIDVRTGDDSEPEPEETPAEHPVRDATGEPDPEPEPEPEREQRDPDPPRRGYPAPDELPRPNGESVGALLLSVGRAALVVLAVVLLATVRILEALAYVGLALAWLAVVCLSVGARVLWVVLRWLLVGLPDDRER